MIPPHGPGRITFAEPRVGSVRYHSVGHRWQRRRLVEAQTLPATQLVTDFGHGKHKCPAQPYSLALTAILNCLLTTFEFDLDAADIPGPEPAQIGGVVRPAGPCTVTYRRTAGVS